MPTVKRIEGHLIKVNVRNEHEPAHVHVLTNDFEIRVKIGPSAVYLSTVFGAPLLKQVIRAVDLVAECLDDCNDVWRQYHG